MPQLSKNTQTTLSEINMIPFIDVVLVLLIIFMITAPILQSGIEVDVPKTQKVYLGNTAINIHELGSKVQSQLKKPQDAVYLRCDETVPFGIFASVVDALRQSGINNISIVTQPLTERSKTP